MRRFPTPRPVPQAPDPVAPRTGLAAVATLGAPALFVSVMTQAPAGPVRGLALALGWAGLACWLERPRVRGRR